MDADVYSSPTLIDDFDHLLIARSSTFNLHPSTSYRHTDQPTELTDTVVHMYNVVADLKLLYFLECKRHLTASGMFAPQVIFMVAVKYLVVGEDT